MDVKHISQLVCDTTRCIQQKGEGLARLLHKKTGGNPFFVNQLLKTFYQEGMMKFDFESGRWQWRVEELEGIISITSNVVDLMLHQIKKMRLESQHVLKLAAAVGDKFSIDVLATVSERTVPSVAADLWDSLQLGLIIPMTPTYNVFVEVDDSQHVRLSLSLSLSQIGRAHV